MHYTLVISALALAVQASPFPQGVTAAIAPSGSMPSGCTKDYTSTFGIAVANAVATQLTDGQPGVKTSAASQLPDGQPQAPVSQISDGQVQAATKTPMPVSQIGDGQIQAGTMTMMAVSQIHDGQIQAPKSTKMAVSQISDGQIQAPTAGAVSQKSDGQPQAPTATASVVSQKTDGQPQAPTASVVSQKTDGQPQAPTASVVSQKTDGQPQAPTATAATQKSDGQPQAPTGAAATQKPDGQPQASGSTGPMMVACKSDDTLELTLSNGILKDSEGRTGYIASNYQFQFDDPPQAGSIYTAGWSTCGNGTLALGGSNIFYECLSGDFYNLYNENWAPQCSPVYINIVKLISC